MTMFFVSGPLLLYFRRCSKAYLVLTAKHKKSNLSTMDRFSVVPAAETNLLRRLNCCLISSEAECTFLEGASCGICVSH